MTWEGNYDINQVIYRVCQFIHKTLKIVFSRWHAIAPHIWSLQLSSFAVKVAWDQMQSPCIGKYQLSPLPEENAKEKLFYYWVIVPRALIIGASSTCFSAGNKQLFFYNSPPHTSLSTTYDRMQRSEGYSHFVQFCTTQSNPQKVSSHFQKKGVDEVPSSRRYKITGMLKWSYSHV